MFPKDPPVIDRDLLQELPRILSRCEWPSGCQARTGLQAAHIRARGMGGGRRKDTPENIIVLCHQHHHRYDHQMGQSPANQAWMKAAIGARREHEIRAIRKFLNHPQDGTMDQVPGDAKRPA